MTTESDRTAIHTLVHRLFRALDAREFAPGWMNDFGTADARMETPLGTTEGAEAVRAAEEALGRYDRTQHIASGILLDVDAGTGRGTASWNALMTHVHHDGTLFTVGGHYEADLRRTPDGWRFSRVAVRAVWTQGRPPLLPEQPARVDAATA
ncbi:nuclear transport factor 2 family protein [Streptomyces yaanensis]|uniref:Nuclear transport factor 2 family protein n=1 Tax=Streptomyces yaanensis TaxID=1142239 RepID=A0ABV7SQX5_9ACTN|nr:nuclear transport factor 2 family protein [Streptomyces sp. CGMCC 4.7035]WNC01977.1 nuclear transport factor 2 family protein [Streptomyces sp. CGMCC 4.7035]